MKRIKTFEMFDSKNGEFLDHGDKVEVNGRTGTIVEFLEDNLITVCFDDDSCDDFDSSEISKI